MLAQSKAIGPAEYEVMPLASGASIRVMTRVLKMGAPAFAEVSSLRDAASAVGTMLSAGLAELDEDALLYVCAEFARVTQVVSDNGARKVALSTCFDEHFRGRFLDMLAWVRFAAEVTYGPLGEALKKLLGAKEAEKAQTPPSPSAG